MYIRKYNESISSLCKEISLEEYQEHLTKRNNSKRDSFNKIEEDIILYKFKDYRFIEDNKYTKILIRESFTEKSIITICKHSDEWFTLRYELDPNISYRRIKYYLMDTIDALKEFNQNMNESINISENKQSLCREINYDEVSEFSLTKDREHISKNEIDFARKLFQKYDFDASEMFIEIEDKTDKVIDKVITITKYEDDYFIINIHCYNKKYTNKPAPKTKYYILDSIEGLRDLSLIYT